MSDPAIVVENLSKVYRLGHAEARRESLSGRMVDLLSSPVRNFRRLRSLDTSRSLRNGQHEADDLLWALRDISFEVRRGEVLGVIGRNGAGKSTLLKVLSRIVAPSSGRVRVNGRVASLLEVGTGFNDELTGRENVYLNGTILGMTRREIDRQFDEIVEFSGVERFLDTPVKRYSSGMRVRLAFSVAAHLQPEILIIDEVLAVGDYEFQKKCLGKIEDVAHGKDGRTILFVSHSMGTMRSLCDRCICLQQGRLAFEGSVEDCIEFYEQGSDEAGRGGVVRFEEDESLPWQMLEAELLDGEDNRVSRVDQFEPLRVRVVYCVRTALVGSNLCFGLNFKGSRLYSTFDTDEAPHLLERRDPGLYETTIELPTDLLKAGHYQVYLSTGTINRQFNPHRQIADKALEFDINEVADSSLKGFSPTRVGSIVVRTPWRTQAIGDQVVHGG